jgi:hypothetical protein
VLLVKIKAKGRKSWSSFPVRKEFKRKAVHKVKNN